MGAFGRLLIKHLGGDLHAYDNAGSSPTIKRRKTSEEIKEENIQRDKEILDSIIGSSEQLFKKAENCISQLNRDVDIYKLFKTDEGFNKFILWREEFYIKIIKN